MTPEELRAARLRHGLSQAELAELVGITAAALSQWERGERPIPLWFEKLHQYALLAHEGVNAAPGLYAKRRGRPYSVERQEKERAKAEALEREEPILCTVRFCEPTDNRPMDPLTFRPYMAENMESDGRRKPQYRSILIEREVELGGPWNIQHVVPMQGWSDWAWNVLQDELRRQLVAMGHLEQMAEMYRLEAGAQWSWHKVATSRPECLVMLNHSG